MFNSWDMRWQGTERKTSKYIEIEADNGVLLEVKMHCECLEFMFRSVSKKHSYNLWNH